MDTEPTELFGGCLKVGLGTWLLAHPGAFSSSSTFSVIAVIPEWAWGGFLLCAGVGRMAALRRGAVPWRRLACLIGFLVWFSFAALFVWSNPPAIGWVAF